MAEEVATPALNENEQTSEFAQRNPVLAKLVPEHMHEHVDKILPDAAEGMLEKAVSKSHCKYHDMRRSMEEGIGEVAGVLFRVAKYAYEKFHFGDLVFGVYHLALHHSTMNDMDVVEGHEVSDLALVNFLIQAATAAEAAYLPTREKLCAAAGITDEQLLIFVPETTHTRPAYAVWVDEPNKRLIWGFRGTTDLNDMLTDACASCTPYRDGYAHWGMLSAAEWFVENELPKVKQLLDERPGYELLLVGHSLGAGTAAMLAHLLKNDAAASAAIAGVKFQAVGIATPAVLTEQLADDCKDYITSVVLMHDMVPRFSIHNVFTMKEEMDATDWGEVLRLTVQDWLVPDVIENTATFQKFAKGASHKLQHLKGCAESTARHLAALGASLKEKASNHFHKTHSNDEANGSQENGDGARSNGTAAAGGGGPSVAEAAAEVSKGNIGVVEQAVEGVADKLEGVKLEDVHQVFAPGRLIFIKRLDKYKGRAKYGNTVHRCILCEDDSVIPKPDEDDDSSSNSSSSSEAGNDDDEAASPSAETDAAASESEQEMYPGAKFALIEAGPQQRFSKIVLQETCLMDHLCGGYMQGLRYAHAKLQTQ